MSKTYFYSDGESIQCDDLQQLLKQNQEYLQNYTEVEENLDSPEYVARGNGFCETQYSDEFIESQIQKYSARIEDIKKWIQKGKADIKP